MNISKPIILLLLIINQHVECRCHESGEKPSQTAKLNAWGHRQVDQMLEDRPEMQNVLSPTHPMYIWVIEGFNGNRVGKRIHWIETPPESGRCAAHLTTFNAYPFAIAINPDTKFSPIDKWAGLIFEMTNIENVDGFASILAQAGAGKLNAQEYADKMVEFEFLAIAKTSLLLKASPLSPMSKDTDRFYNWMMSDVGTVNEYKKAFDKLGMTAETSNYEYYKTYYRSYILPRIKPYQRARRLGGQKSLESK